MAISGFCYDIHFQYWFSMPALGGIGPNDVVCKTCSVHCCLHLNSQEYITPARDSNWFNWLKPVTTYFVPLRYPLDTIEVVSLYCIIQMYMNNMIVSALNPSLFSGIVRTE